MQILILWVSSRARESAFLTSSQVIPRLLDPSYAWSSRDKVSEL